MTNTSSAEAITPQPTGPRPGGATTRGAIEKAARSLFAERGFEGASVRAIAGTAGVDPSLVIRHFGSKEALYRAVLERYLGKIQAERIAARDRAAVLTGQGYVVWDTEEFAAMLDWLRAHNRRGDRNRITTRVVYCWSCWHHLRIGDTGHR